MSKFLNAIAAAGAGVIALITARVALMGPDGWLAFVLVVFVMSRFAAHTRRERRDITELVRALRGRTR